MNYLMCFETKVGTLGVFGNAIILKFGNEQI